ncbi:MAG: choice-of-anchor D domain-containing protein [Verrucomicrobiales bacterium]
MKFHIMLGVGLTVASSARGAELYSEPFDSEGTAKVVVLKDANAAVAFVDYSNYMREMPGAGAPVTLRIPEAPNRIPGSAATRGVVLSALYDGTPRAINLIAAATLNGAPLVFTGDHRLRFDAWLSMDLTATTTSTGTTESGIWGVNGVETVLLSRSNRANGRGLWGWLTNEGGAGAAAGSGDAPIYFNSTNSVRRENLTDTALFTNAFAQGSPIPNTPNNQWTAVEVDVIGTRTVVRFNGVVFFDEDPGVLDPEASSGVARLGYEDLFTGSTAFSRNRIFGLFDNFVVESLAGTPVLTVATSAAIPVATFPGESPSGSFDATNGGGGDVTISAATVDGADASQFSFNTPLPLTLSAGGAESLGVTFSPVPPNGLKVARLVLTTTDPAAPTISLPLQGRRQVLTVEGSVTTPIATVITEGGTSTGEITITNQSAAAVNLTGVTLGGTNAADFSVTTPLPVTLAPGEAGVLAVRFAPTGVRGLRSASLEIATTDAGSPVLSFPVHARYSYGPPLLAHYKMDDTAGTLLADASGNTSPATLQVREAPFGFAQPSLLPGGAATSVRLTPADTTTSGNFAIGDVAHLPTVSYALWVRPGAKAGLRRLLQRSSIFTTTGTLHSLYLTEAGRVVFQVNSLIVLESEDGAAPDDVATHIVVTHTDVDGFGNETGGSSSLYINGALVSENLDAPGQTDYTLNTVAAGLYIGTSTAAGQGYLGLIDDLQVYSVGITAEEAAGLFANPGLTIGQLPGATVDFRIVSFAFDPAARSATLTWNSQPGKTYDVFTSSTLANGGNGGWSLLAADVPSGGATTSFTETNVLQGEEVRFYRVAQD